MSGDFNRPGNISPDGASNTVDLSLFKFISNEDKENADETYVGFAMPGTLDDDDGWFIIRTTVTGGFEKTRQAKLNDNFDPFGFNKKWTLRKSYDYA